MSWERGWFLNISAVSSLKELDHLKVDITYSVHTHTHAHISQNTLIQPTVGLNKFKCMLGKWSVCSAQHTLGQHEEPPGLDFIKYGTTNLAPINFTDFCGVLPRTARAPASLAVAAEVPLHGLFCFWVTNHHQSENEESDKSGPAVNQPRWLKFET